jgi:hypothetical protein
VTAKRQTLIWLVNTNSAEINKTTTLDTKEIKNAQSSQKTILCSSCTLIASAAEVEPQRSPEAYLLAKSNLTREAMSKKMCERCGIEMLHTFSHQNVN